MSNSMLNLEQQFADDPPTTPISFISGTWEFGIWIAIACGAYLMLALVTYTPQDLGWSYSGPRNVTVQNSGGILGAWSADLLIHLFGYLAFLIPIVLIWRGLSALCRDSDSLSERILSFSLRWLGFAITLISGSMLADLYIRNEVIYLPTGPGGIAGQALVPLLLNATNPLSGILALLLCFTLGFTMLSSLPWISLTERLGAVICKVFYWLIWPFTLLIPRRSSSIISTEIMPEEPSTHEPQHETVEINTLKDQSVAITEELQQNENENSLLLPSNAVDAVAEENAESSSQLLLELPSSESSTVSEATTNEPPENIAVQPENLTMQAENADEVVNVVENVEVAVVENAEVVAVENAEVIAVENAEVIAVENAIVPSENVILPPENPLTLNKNTAVETFNVDEQLTITTTNTQTEEINAALPSSFKS